MKNNCEINFKRLTNALMYIKNNLIDSHDKMYLVVDLLIDINNIIIGLNNIFLKKVTIKPFGCDETYMEKDLIKNNLYQLIDQFNKREINHRDFYLELVNNRHSFYYMWFYGIWVVYNLVYDQLFFTLEMIILVRAINKCFQKYF